MHATVIQLTASQIQEAIKHSKIHNSTGLDYLMFLSWSEIGLYVMNKLFGFEIGMLASFDMCDMILVL